MNLIKSREFFDPDSVESAIHIIGCGAIGSTLAENLARLGFNKLHLYDFDTVSPHNIANQMFWEEHITKPKLDAVCEMLKKINPDIELITHPKGWQEGMTLSGYVFLCVDNIDTRRQIITENKYNESIIAVFDLRMRLTDAQHYAASWNNEETKTQLFQSMNFTHEEAKSETPMSACGTTLSVVYTVRAITAYAVANLIKKIQDNKLYKLVLIDCADFNIDAFEE